VVVVAVGLGLVWLGFELGKRAPLDAGDAATVTAAAIAQQTPAGIIVPTSTPLLLPTPTPTSIPPTETAVVPRVEAGEPGLNIRSGPGTNFTRVGRVDPGTQLVVVGRYSDWFQIDFGGTLAWAYSGVVTAYNVDGVGQVVPPPSPTPLPPTATPTATPVPATPVPVATQAPNTHGLVANGFSVERAPGPYGNGGDVWFNIDITNKSGGQLTITKLGAWVQENGEFKVSWGVAKPLYLTPGQRFTWRDHMRPDNMPNIGTYHLWMRACFADGSCANMSGPVEVRIG
jgi:hypothetical protein